eukprot:1089756-Pelagomonas_calceolata.AAC.4
MCSILFIPIVANCISMCTPSDQLLTSPQKFHSLRSPVQTWAGVQGNHSSSLGFSRTAVAAASTQAPHPRSTTSRSASSSKSSSNHSGIHSRDHGIHQAAGPGHLGAQHPQRGSPPLPSGQAAEAASSWPPTAVQGPGRIRLISRLRVRNCCIVCAVVVVLKYYSQAASVRLLTCDLWQLLQDLYACVIGPMLHREFMALLSQGVSSWAFKMDVKKALC